MTPAKGMMVLKGYSGGPSAVIDECSKMRQESAENPLFKKIVDSQRAFAQRAVKWDLDTNVSRRMAFDHYFPSGAKKA